MPKLALTANECQPGSCRCAWKDGGVDAETFAWLLSEPGQALLAEAEALRAEATQGTGRAPDPLGLGSRLRALHPSYDAAHLAAAATQADLRERAVAKLGDLAAQMYFTADGLEQATGRPVAEHRAARLRAAGTTTLVDLGCGIGGDLVACARAGITVAGIDLDPVRVAVATANLAALGLGGAVQVADATRVDVSPFDAAFADPARRSGRGRALRPEEWTPPWDFVAGLLTGDACVKVAPGIAHDLVPTGVEAEWVSDHGEVKEAALWSGRLAIDRRRATVIRAGGLATLTDADEPDEVATREVGRFLYEPDGAVIRAGLVAAVAVGVDGALLDRRIAYVTSDAAFTTPFATSYEVLEELPFREKALRAALRERGVGRLTIKKRGVEVVPEQLRQRLALRGDEEATIVLTRTGGQARCWSVRRFGATG